MTQRGRCAVLFLILATVFAAPTEAGDRFWSATGLEGVWDIDVCGTTVYVATQTGLFRATVEPDEWELVWGGEVSRVACDGNTVLFVANREFDGPVYVSHDAMQTVDLTTGLDSFVSEGIEDLDVKGSQAVAAVEHGVIRSTDGGSSFNVSTVLWESSGTYEITAVWTDGTACVASSDRGSNSGIWYSSTCERYTFTVVDSNGGQGWLSGYGNSVVAGAYFGGSYAGGYVSDDGGASWDPLPFSWDGINTTFHKPFLSDDMIMSRDSYKEYDANINDFVGYIDGLYLFNRTTGDGADLAPGYPFHQKINLTAIVETPDPYLLVAEAIDVWAPIEDAELWWYRVPGGWPADGFDFTPPSPGSLTLSPSVISTSGAASATVLLSASGAESMYLNVWHVQGQASIAGNTITSSYSGGPLGSADGWQAYSSSTQVALGSQHGLYYVDAWFEDDAGNMSDPSVWDATTIVPSSITLGEGQCQASLLWASAGESFTYGAAGGSGSGDVDVYHFEPGSYWSDHWAASIGYNDSLAFTAQASGLHRVYICNYPAGYGIYSGGLIASQGTKSVAAAKSIGRDAPMMLTLPEEHETLPFNDMWEAIAIFDDGFESGDPSAWSSSS